MGSWSWVENKVFEKAVVVFPEGTPARWEKIASQIPGKSWSEVKQHYEDLVHDVVEIESGRVELPSFEDDDELGLGLGLGWSGAESGTGPVSFESKGKERETERRKGIPWTEEEHRLFLIGLQKYGKGDWRSISRNAVVSRTPTQVASHAQKYFLRVNSGKKDKKRSSIHDITTTAATSVDPTKDSNWVELMDQSQLFGPPKPSQNQGNPSAYQGFGFPM